MIEPPETPHAHGHGGGWFDRALAVGVIALSAASLYVALHTGSTMDKLVEENSRLVRAGSTPLLQFGSYNISETGEREIGLTVANVGTGTARVLWFEIRDGGVPRRNVTELIRYSPEASDGDYVLTSPVPQTYMPAGEERTVLSWKLPRAPESLTRWQELDRKRFDLVVSACYCSILGECWESKLAADQPVPVKACDARGRVDFRG